MYTRKRSDIFALCFSVNVILFFCIASANTDPLDVKSLEDLYGLLNQSSMLTGWMATGGDPCGQNWTGVSCSGTSIISIKISGFGLGGTMSSQLSSFLSLTQLDMSCNSIAGEIPSGLPPNTTFINLAANKIAGNIPLSLAYMKNLKYLNVSHNNLSGVVGNAFTEMTSLEILDLSFNSFSGDLPSSFASLKNLHALYLQQNEFTGSVNFFANLPLTNLNIEGNKFEPHFPNKPQILYRPSSEKFRYQKQNLRSPMLVVLLATTTIIIVYSLMAQSPPTPPPMPQHLPPRQATQRAPISATQPPPPPPSPPLPPQAPIRAAPSFLKWSTFKNRCLIISYFLAMTGLCVYLISYAPPALPKDQLFRKTCLIIGDYLIGLDLVMVIILSVLLLFGKIRTTDKFVMISRMTFIIILAVAAGFKISISLFYDVTT